MSTLEDRVKVGSEKISTIQDRIKDLTNKLTDAKREDSNSDRVRSLEDKLDKAKKDLELTKLRLDRDNSHLEFKTKIDTLANMSIRDIINLKSN